MLNAELINGALTHQISPFCQPRLSFPLLLMNVLHTQIVLLLLREICSHLLFWYHLSSILSILASTHQFCWKLCELCISPLCTSNICIRNLSSHQCVIGWRCGIFAIDEEQVGACYSDIFHISVLNATILELLCVSCEANILSHKDWKVRQPIFISGWIALTMKSVLFSLTSITWAEMHL